MSLFSIDHHHYFHGDDGTSQSLILISNKLDYVISKLNTMATEFAQLKTEFDELKNAIVVERQQMLDKLAVADAKIVELEALVAAGGTEEQRAALLADIKTAVQDVKNIIPDTPAPDA